MRVTTAQLASIYRVERRTITNWLNMTPPCPSQKDKRARVFDLSDVAAWYTDRKVREAVESATQTRPADEADARRREQIARAVLAEIAVAEKEGSMIATEVHSEVVEELADRLRAVLVNIPSNYGIDLERVGVDAAKAQDVLGKLATDLTERLRAVVDDDDPES